MARLPSVVATPLVALAVCLGASGLGLAVNAIRPGGLRLVAVLPYEQECPDRVQVVGPTATVSEARLLLAGGRALLVDARPKEEFDEGHIAGARSLPYSFVTPPVAADIARLKRHEQIIVYCDSPGDKLASMLADQLRGLGLANARVLQGGLDAWGRARGARP